MTPPNITIVVFIIIVPSCLWAPGGLWLLWSLALQSSLRSLVALLHDLRNACLPGSTSWLLQAPPLEGAAELTHHAWRSFPELPSWLWAGVEEGPRRQTWKDFLSLPSIPSLPFLPGKGAGSPTTVLGCVSSAPFFPGMIEISKLNQGVETHQFRLSQKAKEDLGGKRMWKNSSDVAGIHEHSPRNSQTQEVGAQTNESNFVFLSSYTVTSPSHPHCSHRNRALQLFSSCRWGNWGWVKLRDSVKVTDLVRDSAGMGSQACLTPRPRAFISTPDCTLKKKKKNLELEQAWGRDSSRLFLFIFQWLPQVVIFTVFLLYFPFKLLWLCSPQLLFAISIF